MKPEPEDLVTETLKEAEEYLSKAEALSLAGNHSDKVAFACAAAIVHSVVPLYLMLQDILEKKEKK